MDDKLKELLQFDTKALKITHKGLKILMKADKVGGTIPDEIKLLSALRNGKKHPLSEFGKDFFSEKTLEKCSAYLKKEMLVIEVNYP
jgi:hypothetical protein